MAAVSRAETAARKCVQKVARDVSAAVATDGGALSGVESARAALSALRPDFGSPARQALAAMTQVTTSRDAVDAQRDGVSRLMDFAPLPYAASRIRRRRWSAPPPMASSPVASKAMEAGSGVEMLSLIHI